MGRQTCNAPQYSDTVREDLDVAIRVKNAIGDPTQIVGLIDDTLLGGALSESGISNVAGIRRSHSGRRYGCLTTPEPSWRTY